MNRVVCVCVLLAALSSGSQSLSSQLVSHRADGEAAVSDISAGAPPSGQLTNHKRPKEDRDLPKSMMQLLAKLISWKGSTLQTRSSISSGATGPASSHRIKDRDYLGWMDFGRRSAEEYEYSS